MPARLEFDSMADAAAAAAAAVGEDLMWVSFWDAAGSGTPPSGGNPLWAVQLDNDPAALTLGAVLRAAADEIQYTQNEATTITTFRESNYLSERKLEGVINGGIHMQYHDDDPGANYTANVMNLARTALAQTDFSITRT